MCRAAGGLDAERDQRVALADEQQRRERQAFEEMQEQRKASFRKVIGHQRFDSLGGSGL